MIECKLNIKLFGGGSWVLVVTELVVSGTQCASFRTNTTNCYSSEFYLLVDPDPFVPNELEDRFSFCRTPWNPEIEIKNTFNFVSYPQLETWQFHPFPLNGKKLKSQLLHSAVVSDLTIKSFADVQQADYVDVDISF